MSNKFILIVFNGRFIVSDNCTKLSQCDPLNWLNEHGEKFGQSRDEIEFKLKNAKCGEENGEVKVLCPKTEIIGFLPFN